MCPADVAIVFDYDSRWAFEAQPAYCGCDYVQSILRYYEGFYRRGINVHFISSRAEFSKYRVVVASHLYVLPDETATRLNEFVKAGGVLLADCRTGVKDETSLCHARTLPGLLAESLGIRIDEYESLEDSFTYEVQATRGHKTYSASLYSDWIRCEDATSLYRYTTPHVGEFAVLTSNRYGDGRGFYLGTIIREKEFYDELAAKLLDGRTVTGAQGLARWDSGENPVHGCASLHLLRQPPQQGGGSGPGPRSGPHHGPGGRGDRRAWVPWESPSSRARETTKGKKMPNKLIYTAYIFCRRPRLADSSWGSTSPSSPGSCRLSKATSTSMRPGSALPRPT